MRKTYSQMLISPRGDRLGVQIGRTMRQESLWVPVRRDLRRNLTHLRQGFGLAEASIVALNQNNGPRYMFIPRWRQQEQAVVVLWRVPYSKRGGSARITADDHVRVIGSCYGAPNRNQGGELLAEMMAILNPGESLWVRRFGPGVNGNAHGRLTHLRDGRLEIVFGAGPLRVV